MPIEVLTLIIAIIALAVGLGALWHSRTNRRIIMKMLQGRPKEAREILFRETEEDLDGYIPSK